MAVGLRPTGMVAITVWNVLLVESPSITLTEFEKKFVL